MYKVERGVKLSKSQISPNNYNPNKTTKRQQEAIAESLDHYGQLLEIVVRPDPKNEGKYLIIDGEHRYQELGDEVFVNVVYGLEDVDAKKLTIIFNETRGQADPVELGALLAELSEKTDDLQLGLPYESDELERLMGELGEDNEDVPEFDPVDPETQPRLDELKPITCPNCGHEFQKDG